MGRVTAKLSELYRRASYRLHARSLPVQEEMERFGANGEDIIYRILRENFSCVIRNVIVPHKDKYLEKDFLVMERGVPVVIEVKNWKGKVGIDTQTGDFFQLKANGTRKVLKSPVGTTAQYVRCMKEFYGMARTVVGMVVFAEPDCELDLPESTIEKHTNYVILYEEDVPVKERVSVFAENKSVESILNEVLTPRGIKYYLNGKQIIVTVDKTKQQSRQSNAKKSWVSGTVVDIAGEAMIGVTIAVQGAQTGTVTDADGKYRIEAQPGDILVFSFVGMKKQEVTFNGKKQVIDIVMDEETNLMDEVVVVGFGTQKKVNLTGAVGVIESKSLEARPVGNAVQALQGLLPGLNITTSNNGAELNATPSINIRGTATIGSTSSGSPLVLIDGMEGQGGDK